MNEKTKEINVLPVLFDSKTGQLILIKCSLIVRNSPKGGNSKSLPWYTNSILVRDTSRTFSVRKEQLAQLIRWKEKSKDKKIK